MRLRALANSITRTVNPNVTAIRRRSGGYTTRSDGARVPLYDDASVVVQAQALAFGDIQKIDGLNIQGVRRKIYTDGVLSGLIRPAQKGGDMLVFPDGTFPEGNTWLCVHVLEQWAEWCAVVITLQDGP